MTVVLKKRKVAKPCSSGKLNKKLAKEASELLGYGALGTAQEAEMNGKRLSQALYDLGISVFNPNSVHSYQKKEADKARDNARRNSGRFYNITAAWKKVPLNKYRKAVPATVLKTAVKIAKVLPDARFVIEELVVNRRKRVLDPFLAVELGTARYYIGQWNEPTFEDNS